MIEIMNLLLILFIILCAIVSVRVKELVSAVFLLGAFSFFVAILWSLLNAPDVSFTEVVVGAGASTIFFLLALFGTKHIAADSIENRWRFPILLVVLALGVLLTWGSLDLPPFGSIHSPASDYLSPFYLQNTYEQMKTPNAVTSIVVDFRGFDTLIETAVIFTAGVACLLIFKARDAS